MPLVAGTKLGPYEITSSIGAGGMGEVYKARDTRLGRDVALKVLPDSFAKDADRLRRFEQEAKAVAALNDPHIMAIHDIGEQNGVPYLVSELLEGGSLRAELQEGKLTPRKVSDYSVQMAQGLSAAHDKNIVHRDFKPENVFITRDGRVKILDFGLAKLATNGAGAASEQTVTSAPVNVPTEAGTVLGTAGYMAPEQVRGTGVDSRTDIFAFGAVLYEMVSGQRAFRRDTTAETMTAILKEDPPEFDDITHPVSPAMERIVRRCLEKKPEQRFQSAKDLAFALEAISGTGSGSTSKTAANAILAEAPKSRRWIYVAAAIPLALLIGGALGWFLRPAAPPPPEFTQVSFHRGDVIRSRFAPDGKTILYSAKLNGGPQDTYMLREDFPAPVSAGLHGAVLLSISKQGQMAVLTDPQYFAHRAWKGTLATTPVGGTAPREILENVTDADWSPDGTQMAVIDGDESRSRLQYPVGKIVLDVENWLSDVRVSPDGKQLAFFRHPPNDDDRGDVMLAGANGQVRVLSTGWESLEGLTWAPSGKEVWFSAATSGEQYCIRAVTTSGKMRTVHCGTSPTIIEDFAASGRALVSSSSHHVAMALLEHGAAAEKDISWLDAPYFPSVSADGSEVLFTDQSGQAGNDYSVYVRKRDADAAVRIGGGGFGNSISPDGKWALVLLATQDSYRMQVVPVGAGQPHEIHWEGFQPIFTRFYPDGFHVLLYASAGKGEPSAYVTDINGSAPKPVQGEGGNVTGIGTAGWSILELQNGKRVVASSPDAPSRAIPPLPTPQIPLAWTGDPDHIFMQQRDGNGVTIFKLDLNTGHEELWQTIRPKEQIGLRSMSVPVGITPDGKWMAYAYGTQTGQLYVSDNLK
jgi:eukaryotic-like serine/threonine-protein kinase